MSVSPADRRRLQALIKDRDAAQKHVWRAEIVLFTADGVGTNEIMRRTGKSRTCVWRWQERFIEEGFEGLLRDKTRPSRIKPLGGEAAERVVALTLGDPPGETTHWTGALMARASGLSVSSVQRIWRAHGLQPRRLRQFKLSNDRRFVDKLRDVVGLYVDPPAHAIVLSVDEKSQIQAPDRTQPGPPLKKGRAGTMTHDYKRHGDRPQHAASSPSGIHSLPKRHRATGSGGKDNPRHRRQLCNAQTSKGAPMACPPPPLDFPLHSNFGVMAQRRRGIFRNTYKAAAEARLHRNPKAMRRDDLSQRTGASVIF